MTTINELPQGWQWVKLGDVTGIFAGYSFNSDDFFIGKGVKCIKITNVGVKKLIETEEVLPNYFREKYVNFLVKENDLIIALTRPYIEEGLKIAICTNNYNDSLLNQRVAVIRDISKINFIYLYFFMTSDIVLNFYQKKFKTANLQPNLRLCDLTELNIPLPPLTEQQRLANLLTEKLNIIEQAKQAIDAQLKAAEDLTAAYLREVFESEEAKSWEWVKLSDVFDITTGKLNSNEADSNGIYPFFTCSREIFRINKYAFDCEAILLAGNNASGDFNVKLYNGKFNAYQRTYIITLKKEYGNNKIIIYYHKLDNYLIELKKQSIGSNTKYLKLPMIENLIVPLPPIEKQKQLANYLTEKLATVEQLKTALKTQRDAINQLPAALLKQAFNGQL